ncbi:acyl-[acyl-carrier-protein] thioesterase [Bacteroidota bacterium]
MQPFQETIIKVRAFDVDRNDRLKISTIFDYLQDAASMHADNLKVGYDDLIPRGFFWVLSWAKFEFINFAKFKDELKIKTWGKKQYKLYSLRDFILFSDKEEVLCKGTTAWLLLDAKSLRPKILTQLFPDVMLLEEENALLDLPHKFSEILETEKLFTKKIMYSDIDLNRHANNAKYVEMVQDCYDQQFHNEHQMKVLTISFLSESKFGDTLEVCKNIQLPGDGADFIEARNLNTGKIVFQASPEWNKFD